MSKPKAKSASFLLTPTRRMIVRVSVAIAAVIATIKKIISNRLMFAQPRRLKIKKENIEIFYAKHFILLLFQVRHFLQ